MTEMTAPTLVSAQPGIAGVPSPKRWADEPEWLHAFRERAYSLLQEIGFPTSRDEDWRFTNIRPILEMPFHRAAGPEQAASALASSTFEDTTGPRLLMVNGRLIASLSACLRDGGVLVSGLQEALEVYPELVEMEIGRTAPQRHAFALLNACQLEDAAVIVLPDRAVLEEPIVVIHVSSSERPAHCYPRVLVHAGRESQATLVEVYLSTGAAPVFTCSVTEARVGDAARIDHYRVNREAGSAYQIGITQTDLGRDSVFRSHSVTLGGRIVRNDTGARLLGEGGECTLNGVYLGRDEQLIDHHTTIDHAVAHCASHELYKGILDARSRGVFNGKILVRQDAQKTDAKQTNQTLLLSREARIDTKPQLEIFADDVRCTHGATVGQLSDESLFYLRSRGIGLEQARALLTYAFANDIVERIELEPLRRELETALLTELPATGIEV